MYFHAMSAQQCRARKCDLLPASRAMLDASHELVCYCCTVRRHVPAATLRAPQQHEECMDGCEARVTCTCGVFIV